MACTRQGAKVRPVPFVGGRSLRRALQVKPSVGQAMSEPSLTATSSDRRLSRLESISCGLVCIGVAVLIIESAVESYSIPRSFVASVLEWPPHLGFAAGLGSLLCIASLSGKVNTQLPRVVVVFAMLYCGAALVGTLAFAYGYAFLMSGFD